MKNYINALLVAKIFLLILGIIVVMSTVLDSFAKDKEEYADVQDKMFSMIADLHIETMGYKRYETIAGYGTSMKERGYAIYKGKKYLPDDWGFIIINTNK